MNIMTSVRRPAIASSLAVAALMLSACAGDDGANGDSAGDGSDGADSPSSESSMDQPSGSKAEAAGAGSIDLTINPGGPITFDASGIARYTVAWAAAAEANGEGDEGCAMVLMVTDPAGNLINAVPVTGCESSMELTLVDGAGDAAPGDYLVELEGAGGRAEATVTVQR